MLGVLTSVGLTDEQKRKAIDSAVAGLAIQEIVKELGLSLIDFWKIRQADPLFENEFICARQEGLESLGDTLLTVTRDEPDVQKARVHSENIKWVLAKRKPNIYGDRIDLNVNQVVDIRSALDEAKRRALPVCDPGQSIDAQYQEIPRLSASTQTDKDSVDDLFEGMDAIEKASDKSDT